MNDSPAIELSNLTTGYGRGRNSVEIGIDYNAYIPSGCLCSLLGTNGSGKSTLLHTLCRDIRPLSGSIKISGKPLSGFSNSEFSRILSIVTTEPIEAPNMTLFDLVETGRAPYNGFLGKSSDHDLRIIGQSLAATGVQQLAARKLSTLSDGERQKGLIAKSLAQETPVILLDEPTAFLDFPSRIEIYRLLHSLCRTEGKTVILSTHDVAAAMQLSDLILLIDRQRILHTGIPGELAASGIVNECFDAHGAVFSPETKSFKITF